MRILGIETSCDETALAIYDSDAGLIAHEIFSQKIHQEYGGVVPELASRDHIRKMVPILEELLKRSGDRPENIDGVAYTAGPGLVGALLVGALFGHSLAFAWQRPAIGVHHLEGHLLAPFLEPDPPSFPFLALLVSGGHTQLIQVAALGAYHLLGEALDDAAGEAFDKTAKLLGLPYPGGPHLAKQAQQGSPRFHFPRPLLEKGLDFSFSGLKTAVATTLSKCNPDDPLLTADIAYAFEQAVVDTLLTKAVRALKTTGLNQLIIAGGVGANETLRQRAQHLAKTEGFSVKYPRPLFCTDNGAMIAYAGCQRLLRGEKSENVAVRARWPLSALCT